MNAIQIRQLLKSKARTDLTTFTHRTFQTISPAQPYRHNWHIEAMAWHLQQCIQGGITRLLITLPPRYLKSICASVAFPAWVLGRDPSKRIVCVSYSAELAGKHARDCRTVMQTDWYRQAFPAVRISSAKNTELDFDTTGHGGRYSTSVGGTLTGRGGDLIIIDDPLKPDEAMSESRRNAANEWFDRTLYSRLNDKRQGVIILIMQRLHVEDLAGYVLGKERWTHLNLPAIAETQQQIQIGANAFYTRNIGEILHEAREDRQLLDVTKASRGSFNFSSQYQQAPVPPEGELIKWDWFRRFDQLPLLEPHDRIVQSWDTASTSGELSDYSVCTTWYVKGKDYYLIDVLRERLIYPDLKRRVIEHARRHNAGTIVIEDKGSGTSLIQDLRLDGTADVPHPIAFAPEHDKITRMSAQSSKIEAGQVYLPQQAVWLDDFRAELLQFPRGRYDDQADSLSQFLNWIDRPSGNRCAVQQIFL
jgi:predicted phage terminase large subunit-like protein